MKYLVTFFGSWFAANVSAQPDEPKPFDETLIPVPGIKRIKSFNLSNDLIMKF